MILHFEKLCGCPSIDWRNVALQLTDVSGESRTSNSPRHHASSYLARGLGIGQINRCYFGNQTWQRIYSPSLLCSITSCQTLVLNTTITQCYQPIRGADILRKKYYFPEMFSNKCAWDDPAVTFDDESQTVYG